MDSGRSFTTVTPIKRVTERHFLLLDSPDFRKFDHAVPIEKRTNADGSIIEEVFENERLQPFRVRLLLCVYD